MTDATKIRGLCEIASRDELIADLEQSKARHKMCQESLATATAERDALRGEVERLRLAADMLREIPRVALSADKVYREDWEELFTDEDGAALYLDTAVDRVLDRIGKVRRIAGNGQGGVA